MCEGIAVCHQRKGATCLMDRVRDATEHPTVQRALPPTTASSVQNVNCAKVEQPHFIGTKSLIFRS
jgi:hypothetical protein